MLPQSLLAQTARGAGWIVGWRTVTRLLGFLNTLILVRLLVPGDFGLVALGTSFAQAIEQLSSLGIEEALIRERTPTRDVYDTAFTINVLRGLLTAAVVCSAAWPVAMFFRTPELFPILLALAVGSLVGSFENIGIVEFRRNFAFEKEFKLLIVPRLLAIVVTATAATLWQNHWALVVGILTMQILRTGLGYAMHPFRPRVTLVAWRQLAEFSSWTWGISILLLVRDRVDSFIIGRVLDPTKLGIYTISAEIATIPTYELAAPLGRACMSGFAAARHRGVDVAQIYLRVIGAVSLITLPAGAGISLLAGPVVLIVFGPAWHDAIPLVELIGLAGVTFVFGTIGSTLLAAHGLLRWTFTICATSVVFRAICVTAFVGPFGFLGAAIGWAVAMTIENILYVTITFRHLGIPLIRLVRSCWRSVTAATIMSTLLYATGYGWTRGEDHTGSALHIVAVAVPLGAAIYFAALLGFWLISGRPAGAETDVLEFGRAVIWAKAVTVRRRASRFLGAVLR